MDAIVAQLSEVKAKGRAMSVTHFRRAVTRLITYVKQAVYLVGGFAASDWLFRSLKEDLGGLGISLCRPENHMFVHSLQDACYKSHVTIVYLCNAFSLGIKPWPTVASHFTSIDS